MINNRQLFEFVSDEKELIFKVDFMAHVIALANDGFLDSTDMDKDIAKNIKSKDLIPDKRSLDFFMGIYCKKSKILVHKFIGYKVLTIGLKEYIRGIGNDKFAFMGIRMIINGAGFGLVNGKIKFSMTNDGVVIQKLNDVFETGPCLIINIGINVKGLFHLTRD